MDFGPPNRKTTCRATGDLLVATASLPGLSDQEVMRVSLDETSDMTSSYRQLREFAYMAWSSTAFQILNKNATRLHGFQLRCFIPDFTSGAGPQILILLGAQAKNAQKTPKAPRRYLFLKIV